MVDGVFVQVFFGDDWLDDMFHQITGNLFVSHIFRMLARNNDGMATNRDRNTILKFVLAGNLGLGIRTDPITGSVLTNFRDFGSQLRRQHVRQGHHRLGFVGRISEHDSLVTGSKILHLGGVDGLGNIRRLLLNGDNDVASLVVKALRRVVVANVLDGIPNDLLVVDSGRSGNLTENHDHTSLAAGFAGDTRGFVAGKAGI
mmetsp:Transcript_68755/g.103690  ORF Transcript_68755/g.103690 Transcript_68755/m.103690 type:complete len:201 (+) Transcript_68755:717-1319(+)